MRFLYKAKNSKGEIITGTVRADTLYEAEKVLTANSLATIEVVPEKSKKAGFRIGSKITLKDKALFARQLATMISSGLPLTKAVTLVSSQARTERLRQIYHEIYQDLEEGSSFSGSLVKHPEMFDRVFVSIVNSGEATGKLDVVMNQLAVQLENDNNFSGKVKGVLYYPAFITLALIAVGAYMTIVVIPQLKTIFDQANAELPFATRTLLGISSFLQHYWFIALGALAGLIAVFRIWLFSDSGSLAISYLEINTPTVKSLSEGIIISRFARVLQMLIGSGVPLLDSLRTSTATMKNEIYEEHMLKVINKVEKGIPLSSELLKDSVFPSLMGQMVAVGEETGQLDKVLGKVADYYEEEVSEKLKSLSSLIEPVLLLVIGFAVAFVVFAVLVPIFNVAQLQ